MPAKTIMKGVIIRETTSLSNRRLKKIMVRDSGNRPAVNATHIYPLVAAFHPYVHMVYSPDRPSCSSLDRQVPAVCTRSARILVEGDSGDPAGLPGSAGEEPSRSSAIEMVGDNCIVRSGCRGTTGSGRNGPSSLDRYGTRKSRYKSSIARPSTV